MSRNVTHKCLYCDNRYTRQDLVTHIEEEHEHEIPEGFTAFRLVFNYVNHKPLTYHGKCTECGSDTPWDENKGRYDRQCGRKACHDSYVKKFEENMMKTRGVTRISTTEEGQKKMLAARKISGTYTFRDGGKKTYCGSYEKKALEFMDKVLEIKSADIMAPGPILEYQHEGKTHIYITDFYYQPYNLIIEVKDGGDNPNKRNMPEYRQKQIEKERYIIKNTNYNYLRLTNNDLQQLMSIFVMLKLQMIENTGERVIHVNENMNPLNEYMNALMSGKVVGLNDSDAYIVNYIPKRVFADEPGENEKYNINEYDFNFGVTNGTFTKIIHTNEDCKLVLTDLKDEVNLKYASFYKLGKSIKEVSEILSPYMGELALSSFIYEKLTGKTLYTLDQVSFTLEKVKGFVDIPELVKDTILENKVDKLEKSVKEVLQEWIGTISSV